MGSSANTPSNFAEVLGDCLLHRTLAEPIIDQRITRIKDSHAVRGDLEAARRRLLPPGFLVNKIC